MQHFFLHPINVKFPIRETPQATSVDWSHVREMMPTRARLKNQLKEKNGY